MADKHPLEVADEVGYMGTVKDDKDYTVQASEKAGEAEEAEHEKAAKADQKAAK